MKKIFSAVAALAMMAVSAHAQTYPSPKFNNVTILGAGTAATQTQGDNSTKLATTSYVDTGLAGKASLVGGVIPIAQGGTNAATASGARGQLGAAASGTNSDITSISGLMTALSIGQGGTGSTSASGARTNLGLGTVAIQNTGTSGANVPLLNGNNTWSANQTLSTSGYSIYFIDAPTGSFADIIRTTKASSVRWDYYLADDTPETGSNAGSNFSIYRYSDAGSRIDSPLSITRSTGNVNITDGLIVGGGGVSVNSGGLTVYNATPFSLSGASGTNRTIGFFTGASQRWGNDTSSTAETGSNAGSDWRVNRYSDAGSFIDTPLSITRSTGVVNIGALNATTSATINSLSLTTALPITSGGTGSGTAATAFSNLGGTAVGKAASTMSGTWTPSLTFGGGSTGLTTSVNTGTYTRIGNLVFYQVRITLTAVGSSTGTAVISGLPFTNGPAYSISNVYAANFVGGSAPLQGLISGSSSAINVYTANGASGTGSVALTNANFTNTSSMVFQGVLDLNTLN